MSKTIPIKWAECPHCGERFDEGNPYARFGHRNRECLRDGWPGGARTPVTVRRGPVEFSDDPPEDAIPIELKRRTEPAFVRPKFVYEISAPTVLGGTLVDGSYYLVKRR